MAGRRKGRELALQMLFQWDFSKEAYEEARKSFWTLHQEVDLEVQNFSNQLVEGTIENIEIIDNLLACHTEHWRLPRMAAVDRNILRMATFELLHETETPSAVVINEALEVARKFSTHESIHFINGVLDSIRKDREGQSQTPKESAVTPLKPDQP